MVESAKHSQLTKSQIKKPGQILIFFLSLLDGSDELDCDNDSVPFFNQITCPLGQYKCRNNRCISLMYRCDGANDCIDFSKFKKFEFLLIHFSKVTLPSYDSYKDSLLKSNWTLEWKAYATLFRQLLILFFSRSPGDEERCGKHSGC